jgi:chemotaxis protein MotB
LPLPQPRPQGRQEIPLPAVPSAAVPAFSSRSREARHARHRGGAWKVAYADFVTALMALFIVLWLVNAGPAVKASVAGYFRDPRGFSQRLGAGPAGAGEGVKIDVRNTGDLQRHLEAALREMPGFREFRKNVNLAVTGDGLRVDLMESEQGLFFVSGRPAPTDAGRRLLRLLAAELTRMANPVVIEGHTDSKPFRNAVATAGYGNWELSVDRANAARRVLHEYGVPAEQVQEVRGFADRRLIPGTNSEDPRNRRVSLVVRFRPE